MEIPKEKILLVDDEDAIRGILSKGLSARGYICDQAENGEQAISLYNEVKPDFVTLDITMPGVDGLHALDSILSEHPDAKVVIVSAVGQKQIVFQALSKGAKDFIVKPFERERVLRAVNRLFD